LDSSERFEVAGIEVVKLAGWFNGLVVVVMVGEEEGEEEGETEGKEEGEAEDDETNDFMLGCVCGVTVDGEIIGVEGVGAIVGVKVDGDFVDQGEVLGAKVVVVLAVVGMFEGVTVDWDGDTVDVDVTFRSVTFESVGG